MHAYTLQYRTNAHITAVTEQKHLRTIRFFGALYGVLLWLMGASAALLGGFMVTYTRDLSPSMYFSALLNSPLFSPKP